MEADEQGGLEDVHVHSPFPTPDSHSQKSKTPRSREDPKRTESLVSSGFATHNWNWADIQNLLNTLIGGEEERMMMEKAELEAGGKQGTNPGHPRCAGMAPAMQVRALEWSPPIQTGLDCWRPTEKPHHGSVEGAN